MIGSSDLLGEVLKAIYLDHKQKTILFVCERISYTYKLNPVMCYDAFFSSASDTKAIYGEKIKDVKKRHISTQSFDSIYVKKEAFIIETEISTAEIEYTWVYRRIDSAYSPSIEIIPPPLEEAYGKFPNGDRFIAQFNGSAWCMFKEIESYF